MVKRATPYRSSALQWLGPFFSKKILHTADEWQDLNNRGKEGFCLLSQSWELWLSLPQKGFCILEAHLLYWVLSSTWGQLNLYWDCDFQPAKRKPILSSFSLFPTFTLSADVSCESLLSLIKFQVIPFICRVFLKPRVSLSTPGL